MLNISEITIQDIIWILTIVVSISWLIVNARIKESFAKIFSTKEELKNMSEEIERDMKTFFNQYYTKKESDELFLSEKLQFERHKNIELQIENLTEMFKKIESDIDSIKRFLIKK
jgi:biopolymer transport protein ExbB/TolQ